MMIRAALTLAMALSAMQAQATEISGKAKAIDSTTIRVGDQRVLLFGIDSVSRKQMCTRDDKPWPCWQEAVNALQALLDQGPAVCETTGQPDVFGRVLARCKVNDQSVNEQLVAEGFAVARTGESSEYVAVEAEAKKRKVGLWQGQFVQPAQFRRSVGIVVDRP
jgi:endonuclease YncB( thermonuclease family)